jgi:hypothetical protein
MSEANAPASNDQARDPVVAQINNNFQYHAPKPGQPEIYSELRARGKDLALLISGLVPNSRERSLALTKLEEAIFWANAGIARNG